MHRLPQTSNKGQQPAKLNERRRVPSSSRFWVIVGNQAGHPTIFTTDFGAGERLPVFSFRQEAALFLKFGMKEEEGRWRLQERSPGELISLLHGPNANMSGVVLDPLPTRIAGSPGVVSLSRDRFVRSILDRARRLAVEPLVSHDSSGAVVGANHLQETAEETTWEPSA